MLHSSQDPNIRLALDLLNHAQIDSASHIIEQGLKDHLSDPNWLYAQVECLARRGQFAQSLQCAESLVQMGADTPRLWHTIARLHVSQGRFAEGVKIMTALRPFGLYGDPPLKTRAPLWDGQDPRGKIICLATEGGVGDVVCFARFARDLRDRGARVVVATYPELCPLLRSAPGVEFLVDREAADKVLIDAWIPALSATYALHLDWQQVSGRPYLSLDTEVEHTWRQRVDGPGLKVGLCWQGRKSFCEDHLRSMPGSMLAPLLDRIPGVSWYKVQLWEEDNRLEHPNLIDLTGHIASVTDLAGLISSLDLLISIDSAPAHLGGALGTQTWLLNRSFGWITFSLSEADKRDAPHPSPWYETMRVYTQATFGDWSGPMRRMEADLSTYSESFSRP